MKVPFSLLASFAILLIFTNCNSSDGVKKTRQAKTFFDFPAYFNTEIERLNMADVSLKKQVSIGEKSENLTSKPEDFSAELRLFSETDINRSSWADKYRSDSLMNQNNIERLTYTALDSSLSIREIRIDYEGKNVAQIDIYKRQQSFVGSSRQRLRYTPKEGYLINSYQKTWFSKPKTLEIAASFE